MTAVGVKTPRTESNLKATLQAQFEVILIESARSAAARCAVECIKCIEEEREIYVKLCSEQAKVAAALDYRVAGLESCVSTRATSLRNEAKPQTGFDQLATEAQLSGMEERKAPGQQAASELARLRNGNSIRLADIAIDAATDSLSRGQEQAPEAPRFAAMPSLKTQILAIRPVEVLRKVDIIREAMAKIDSDEAPSSYLRSSTQATNARRRLPTLVPQDFKNDTVAVDTQCILNVLSKIREDDIVRSQERRGSQWKESVEQVAASLGAVLQEEATSVHKTEKIDGLKDEIKAGNAQIVVPYTPPPVQTGATSSAVAPRGNEVRKPQLEGTSPNTTPPGHSGSPGRSFEARKPQLEGASPNTTPPGHSGSPGRSLEARKPQLEGTSPNTTSPGHSGSPGRSFEARKFQLEGTSPNTTPPGHSGSPGRSLEAAKIYAQRNAELGRYLAEITADLQRACILSSSKPTLRSASPSPIKEREELREELLTG